LVLGAVFRALELLGYSEVSTLMIDTPLLEVAAGGTVNPLDALGGLAS